MEQQKISAGEASEKEKVVITPMTDKEIKDYIDASFSEATMMVASEYPCLCSTRWQRHYSAWPAVKSEGEIVKLSSLPFCPARIAFHSKHIRKPISEIMELLEC